MSETEKKAGAGRAIRAAAERIRDRETAPESVEEKAATAAAPQSIAAAAKTGSKAGASKPKPASPRR